MNPLSAGRAKAAVLPVFAALVLALQGCGPKVLDFRNAEIANGKLYAEDANEPFTGKVTNVPITRLPVGAISTQLGLLTRTTGDQVYQSLFMVNALAALLGHGSSGEGGVLCDVLSEKGRLDTGKWSARSMKSPS